jgi:hypothetical protein
MANITINNTDKAGWLRLQINDYYDGLNGDAEHYVPASSAGILRICRGAIDTVEFVEMHIVDKKQPFFFTNGAGNDNIRTVDTINGVVPTSLDDLKLKILALLP